MRPEKDFLVEKEQESVEEGLEKAERLLSDLQVQEPFWIKPFTDFDGPVRSRNRGGDEFHEGVVDAFQELVESESILNPGIISGRGIGYLLGQIDRLGLNSIDVAGEMGAVYFRQDSLEKGMPDRRDASYLISDTELDKEGIYSFNSVLFDHLADQDLQLMYGDNMSNVVGSACIEAYGINLPEERFSVENSIYRDFLNNPTSQDIQNAIEGLYRDHYSDQHDDSVEDHFDFQGDLIRFDKSLESIRVLSDALAFKPFVPLGFQDEGGGMTIFPEYTADPEFDYEDFENFVSGVVEDYNDQAEEEFWASTYHDFSFDYGRIGYENLKTRAAKRLVDETGISDPIVPTNTGDKQTDVLEIDSSLFFAQRGTEAESYCRQNDIPYIPVENTAESYAIQGRLAMRNSPSDV